MKTPIALSLAVLLCGLAPQEDDVVAIQCGKILTMAGTVVNNGVIVIKGGKIHSIGKTVPEGARVVDASNQWATPGLIDLHCHIGGTMRDINDMVNPLNPELSTKPTIDPGNASLKRAVAGGVTTVLYIPGSGTNVSGFGTLMKTAGGKKIEDLIVRFPGAMKVAQAWNPERRGGDLGATRMGMWWNIRKLMDRAKDYHDAWTSFEKGVSRVRPKKEEDLDRMRLLFQHKVPVIIHTADMRDVMGTVRIFHDEYKLKCIVSHGSFNGALSAGELARRGVPANIGPRLYDFNYFKYDARFEGIPYRYWKSGVENLSINTDSPVVPQEDLIYQASMAARFGLPEKVALRAVTIEPAKAVLIDKRLGSLEKGKDADIVLWAGNPLDIRNPVSKVFINGKVVYDAEKDGRRY